MEKQRQPLPVEAGLEGEMQLRGTGRETGPFCPVSLPEPMACPPDSRCGTPLVPRAQAAVGTRGSVCRRTEIRL